MQAVIQTGGKQVSVSEGDIINVELLSATVGDEVTFSDVRLVVGGSETRVGTPAIDGASVKATVLAEIKGPKTRAVFFRRRNDSMTTKGHRQNYHQVKITAINA